MADGYIENRMAEHRAGGGRTSSAARRRNALDCAMPEKRVLIVSPQDKLSASIAKVFSESGCKVALMAPPSEIESQSVSISGVRIVDSNSDHGLERLLHVWHDVDILIANLNEVTGDQTADIVEMILAHRESLPLPNSYGLRLIQLAYSMDSISSDPSLSGLITANRIYYSDAGRDAASVARTCLFLALPWAADISGSTLTIKSREK